MKTRRLSLATAALVLALAQTSAALAGTSRGFENGGKFVRFDPVVAEYNRNGQPFRIVGQCASACTLFLAIKNVCVERTAKFQFHSGNDGKGNYSTYANRHLLDHYNPKLRKFVVENGFLTSFSFSTISGQEMIEKFGYPECTAQHRLAADDEPKNDRGAEGSFVDGARPANPSRGSGNEGRYISR